MTAWQALRKVAEYARYQERCAAHYYQVASAARKQGDAQRAAAFRAFGVSSDGAAAGARNAAKDVLQELRRAGL